MAKAAREAKVATQMGNQGMAFEGNRLINEWIWRRRDRPGARGPRLVRPAHAQRQAASVLGAGDRAAQGHAARARDARLGPVARSGALRGRTIPAYAPFRWRGWWDFGSGGLGDMGIHNLAPGLLGA